MLFDHLEKLKIFHAAALEGSFAAAAKSLRLTQPGITKSIRLLEEELGTLLFLRHRRGVELTDAGKLMLQFSEQISLRARDMEHQVQNLQEMSGILRIGTYETLGESFWPKVLKDCQAKIPQLRIELTSQESRMWQNLKSGAIDLIVDAEPVASEECYSEVLYVDRFALFAKSNSTLLQHPRWPAAIVHRAIDREGLNATHHLRSESDKLDFSYDLESFTMVRSFILKDLCVGVMPVRLAQPHLQSGQLQKIILKGKREDFGEHRICATSLEARRREPRIKEFVKILKANNRNKAPQSQ